MAHVIQRLSSPQLIQENFLCPICLELESTVTAVANGILGHDNMHGCHERCFREWIFTRIHADLAPECPICRIELFFPPLETHELTNFQAIHVAEILENPHLINTRRKG